MGSHSRKEPSCRRQIGFMARNGGYSSNHSQGIQHDRRPSFAAPLYFSGANLSLRMRQLENDGRFQTFILTPAWFGFSELRVLDLLGGKSPLQVERGVLFIDLAWWFGCARCMPELSPYTHSSSCPSRSAFGVLCVLGAMPDSCLLMSGSPLSSLVCSVSRAVALGAALGSGPQEMW